MILAYNLVGYVGLVAGFAYAILGFVALAHLQQQHKRAQSWVPIFIWPFKPERYDEIGQKMCRIGKLLFVLIVEIVESSSYYKSIQGNKGEGCLDGVPGYTTMGRVVKYCPYC